MTGIYFYLQTAFCLFLLWATTMALYMGAFRAHAPHAGSARKALSAVVSFGFAAVVWFFAYSWTYLSW